MNMIVGCLVGMDDIGWLKLVGYICSLFAEVSLLLVESNLYANKSCLPSDIGFSSLVLVKEAQQM